MAQARAVAPAATVDRGMCNGCGFCMVVAPERFALDRDGLAMLLEPAAGEGPHVRLAAAHCPAGAIRLPAAARLSGGEAKRGGGLVRVETGMEAQL
jgi:ferredoxin